MGVAMALGVFFVLFLSASRLSFLGMPGAFWPQVFGLEPRLAFALGLLAIWVRLLGQARSVKSFLVAGITWGLLAWLDPRIAAYAALSAVVWVGVAWKLSRATWKMFLPLAVGLFLFLPWTGGFEPVHVSSETGTWYFAFDRLLSLTLDKGLVFYLALFSIMRMVRGKRLPELHFAVVVITGFGLWIASCLFCVGELAGRPPASRFVAQLAGSDGGGSGYLWPANVVGRKSPGDPGQRSSAPAFPRKTVSNRSRHRRTGRGVASLVFPLLVASGFDGLRLPRKPRAHRTAVPTSFRVDPGGNGTGRGVRGRPKLLSLDSGSDREAGATCRRYRRASSRCCRPSAGRVVVRRIRRSEQDSTGRCSMGPDPSGMGTP